MINSFLESINDNNSYIGNNEIFTLSQLHFPNQSLDHSNNNYHDIKMIDSNEELSLWDNNNGNNVDSYNSTNKSELEKRNHKFISFKSEEPELFTSNAILSIIEKHKDLFREFKKLEFSEYIEYDLNLTKKKRIRPLDFDALISNNNLKKDEGKTKRGRKTEEQKREIHDKRSPDNIIRKVKIFIFNNILLFLNKIINENWKYKVELIKLDHKFVNRIKADQELKYLDMSLKDLFSKDISPKYQNKFPKDYNKEIISRILKDADDIILFAFNINIKDWLDMFTLKKSVKDIVNGYNKYKDCQNLIEKIEQSMIKLDKAINEIEEKENNDKDYMPLFICCLYNYERWFYLKKCRKRDKKKKK